MLYAGPRLLLTSSLSVFTFSFYNNSNSRCDDAIGKYNMICGVSDRSRNDDENNNSGSGGSGGSGSICAYVSDHIGYHNLYLQFKYQQRHQHQHQHHTNNNNDNDNDNNSKSSSGVRKWCYDNNINYNVLCEIDQLRDKFRRLLVSSGVIVDGSSTGGDGSSSGSSGDSVSHHLIRCVICSGIGIDIIRCCYNNNNSSGGGKSSGGGNTKSIILYQKPTTTTTTTNTTNTVSIHKSSLSSHYLKSCIDSGGIGEYY